MAQTMINFCIDENIKKEMKKICHETRMTITITFTIFGTKVTKEKNTFWNYYLEKVNEESQYSFNDSDSLDFVLGSNDIDIIYQIMLRQNDVSLSESLEVLKDIGNRTYLYASIYLICLKKRNNREKAQKIIFIRAVTNKICIQRFSI